MRFDADDVSRYWRAKKDSWRKTRDLGIILVIVYRNRVQVVCSYNPEFVKAAQELSGRWRKRTQTWAFKLEALRRVVDSCVEVFGKDRIRVVNNTGVKHG